MMNSFRAEIGHFAIFFSAEIGGLDHFSIAEIGYHIFIGLFVPF
jgi:hypothetical protein